MIYIIIILFSLVFWLYLNQKKELQKALKNNRVINNRLTKLENRVPKVPFFKEKK